MKSKLQKLRTEEEWARRIIEAELLASVRQHDDGSWPGMYDLEIAYSNGRTAAVEVTSAGDSEAIEWWRLANGSGGRWIVEGIQGGWAVVAEPSSSIKVLRAELPKLLLALESQLIKSIDVRDCDQVIDRKLTWRGNLELFTPFKAAQSIQEALI